MQSDKDTKQQSPVPDGTGQSNKETKLRWVLVLIIVLVAFFLRVYKISEYPAGLNADEAAIGYNAYSLLQTGKDEFGHPWPINFQSFNDFKPGFYFYLVLPFVRLLGLNELAVRLPSVILGTLTVGILYLLVKELFSSQLLAFSSSLLLAVSPWHLHFSRGGWESNVATFFMTLGLYLFYLSLKNPKNFAFCILSFALSMYTYHSARIIAPLLVIGLVILFRKKIFSPENIRQVFISIIVGMLLIFPIALSFLNKEGTSRFSGVGILADQGPLWRANEERGQHPNPFSFSAKILHNKYFEYSLLFLNNYLKHFDGNFLFISGDEIQRNKVPEIGQMYLIEIPFLILGIYFLIKNKPKNWQFVFWWLTVAPVASALTFQSPHAIRSLNMVIPLVVISAYGLVNLWSWARERGKAIAISLSCYLVISYLWNFSFYLHQYYVHYPKTYPAAWEYGFKELVTYVDKNKDRLDQICVTNKYDQPYILFAFYLKYPPEKFQQEAKLTPRDRFGFSTVEHFGKYSFGEINLKEYKAGGRTMIIGAPNEIPDSATIVKRIYFEDGKTEAFRIVEN